MDKDLDAYDREWREGDRKQAVVMAEAYVSAHPEEFALFPNLTIPALVSMVDAFREVDDFENVLRVEVWLKAEFEPQVIVAKGSSDPDEEPDPDRLASPVAGVRRSK